MIFILNRNEQVVGTLVRTSNSSKVTPYFDDILTEDLATGSETFQFSTLSNTKQSRYLVNGNYIAIQKGKYYKLFQITEIEEEHDNELFINVYCETAGLELINKPVRPRTISSANVRQFLDTILNETGWRTGYVDVALKDVYTIEIKEYKSVHAVLQEHLTTFGAELEFRFVIQKGKISKKYVDVYSQRGKFTGKRFEYGKDIEKIVRKTNSTNIATALIGVGKNNLDFKSVEGRDEKGNVVKPIGQDFIVDQEAFDKYNNNGYHIFGIFNYDTESPEELYKKTVEEMKNRITPQVEYEVSVILLGKLLNIPYEDVSLGDTVYIVDNTFNPPIHLAGRVTKLETSMADPQSSKCTLANFVEVKSNITDEMRNIASKLEGYVNNTIDSKFPVKKDDISNGAVTTEKIYDLAITNAKIQDLNADKITAGSIKTEVLTANVINAINITTASAVINEAKIGELSAGKITSGSIKTELLEANVIDAINISTNTATINSAKIGELSADKITSGSIKTELLTANVISAINGYIGNATIDSAKIGEIDAGKITTGKLSADVIDAGTITADKLLIGDFNNLVGYSTDNNIYEYPTTTVEREKFFVIGSSANAQQLLFKSPQVDFRVDDEYIFRYRGNKDGNIVEEFIVVKYHYKDGTTSMAGSSNLNLTTTLKNYDTVVRIEQSPEVGKEVDYVTFSIKKDGTTTGSFRVGSMVLYRRTSAVEIANGSITAEKIEANAITTDLLKANVIEAINISTSNAVIDTAKIGELSADKITTGTLDAKKIQVKNLNANSIVTGTIDANKVNVINVNAGNINTGTIDATKVTIQNLNAGSITSGVLDAGKITVRNLSANSITSGELDATRILVKNLSANSIVGGILDASKITVTNLKADSITAGSITVEGTNLIHGTDFKTLEKWSVSGNVTIDTTKTHYGTNSVKMVDISNLYSEFIPAKQGETFVISAKAFVEEATKPSSNLLFILEEYTDEDTSRIGYQETSITNTVGVWQDYVQSWKVVNEQTTRIRVRIYNRSTGITWVAKPMLSRGSIASIWKLHTDEQISDGAIDNDKIKNEAITTDKLFLDEIFGNSATIGKIQAVEINASQIGGLGKISSDYLDIEGIVSFSALDGDMQNNFIFDPNSNQTYINGGSIFANTITGSQINTRGFKAKNENNETTFEIDSKTGEVTLSGTIQSSNYSDIAGRESGYKLTPDGNATLNDATIRGSVILPNAGITDFESSEDIGRNLLPINNLEGFNSTQFSINDNEVRVTKNSQYAGVSVLGLVDICELNKTYTLSCKFKKLAGTLSNFTAHLDSQFEVISRTVDGVSVEQDRPVDNPALDNGEEHLFTLTFKRTVHVDSRVTEANRLVIQPNKMKTTEVQVLLSEIQLVEGTDLGEWYPHGTTTNQNAVRFWAGRSFERRHEAPFIVYQDGKVKATEGEFGGTITGKLGIGNIHIEDTNTTKGSIEFKDNDDRNTIIKLSEDENWINSNFILGDKENRNIEFNHTNKDLTIRNGSKVVMSNQTVTSTLNNDGSVVETVSGVSEHMQKYENGTYTFRSKGTQSGADYSFKKTVKEGSAEKDGSVDVRVEGDLYIKNRITMNNNIAIVSKQDKGNSGFDYVVR